MRTTKDLANLLFEELRALEAGESTATQARAKAAVANAIISLARLEIESARYLPSARLGSDGNTAPLRIA